MNIVYRKGSKNLANAPRCWPNNRGVTEGCCTATVQRVWHNAAFRLWQLSAAVAAEDKAFDKVPPGTRLDLLCKSCVKAQ